MFLNIHTISLIFAQINSHSAYIPVSKTTGEGLGMTMHVTREGLKTPAVTACDIFGFLQFFCDTESLLLIAALIQTEKINKLQMNACILSPLKEHDSFNSTTFHLHFSQSPIFYFCSPVTCERLIWNPSESVIFS